MLRRDRYEAVDVVGAEHDRLLAKWCPATESNRRLPTYKVGPLTATVARLGRGMGAGPIASPPQGDVSTGSLTTPSRIGHGERICTAMGFFCREVPSYSATPWARSVGTAPTSRVLETLLFLERARMKWLSETDSNRHDLVNSQASYR